MPDVISLAGRPYVGQGYRTRDPADLDAIGVHHTVSGGDWSGWRPMERSIEDEIAHALAIARYHDGLGYGGCGYTDLVFASGRIYRMGPPEQQRAGIGGGHNRHVYSWAFVGNLDLAWPTPAALLAGGWLIHDIRRRLGKDQATMPARGHKEFVAGTSWATACPGKLYREWMPQLMMAANGQEEDDMAFTEEDRRLLGEIRQVMRGDYVRVTGTDRVWEVDVDQLTHVLNPSVLAALRDSFGDVRDLPPTDEVWRLPVYLPGGLPNELR